ncbi:TNF receptor-associated factor 5-like isoform X1 [Symsagittifera roscoffensis]|uniref:TNF receptor-associated factor 5-like isoform X1 n=1 Tax=Symsagittifera roscoffensis TaxID=84072 RepID=UPI00307BEAD7
MSSNLTMDAVDMESGDSLDTDYAVHSSSSNPGSSGSRSHVSGYPPRSHPSHDLHRQMGNMNLNDSNPQDPTFVEQLSRVFDGEDLQRILHIYAEVEALHEKTNMNEIMTKQVVTKYNDLSARVRKLEEKHRGKGTNTGTEDTRNTLKDTMLKDVDDAVTVLCNELLLMQSTIEAHKMQNSRDKDSYEKRILDLQSKITEKKHRMRTDGKLNWRIKDYDRLLKLHQTTSDVEKMSIVSSHFQTPSGHEFRLRVFLNGTGKGKGKSLSMFIQCYRSEMDDILDYPFNGVIVFRVFDQTSKSEKKHHKLMFRTNNSPCFQRPAKTIEYTPENGLAQLLPHDQIHKSETHDGPVYLKDDTIFVGCEIMSNT